MPPTPRRLASRLLDRVATRVADHVAVDVQATLDRHRGAPEPVLIPTGPTELLRRLPNGRMIYLDMRDTSIAPHIAAEGVWEWAIGDTLRRLVQPDDVVVDVGANFGYHTLLLSTEVPLRKDAFHLFEPNPAVAACLRRSLQANRIADACVLDPSALSDVTGTLPLQTFAENWGDATLQPLDRVLGIEHSWTRLAIPAGAIDVPTLRFDDYCERRGIERVGLVKVDAEGHEDAVVRGMHDVIDRSPDLRMVLEFTFDAYADAAGFWDELSRTFPIRYALGYDARLTPVRTLADLRATRPPGFPIADVVLAKRPPSAAARS